MNMDRKLVKNVASANSCCEILHNHAEVNYEERVQKQETVLHTRLYKGDKGRLKYDPLTKFKVIKSAHGI